MVVYHASGGEVIAPEVRKVGYPKDFSWGFYCTKRIEQAKRWAIRGKRTIGGGVPTINYFEYCENPQLSVLRFESVTDEWLDFIAHCRSGGTHKYDIVDGPMANDTIWNYVNDYLEGNINRRQFWVLAEFKHPTHQISFHTAAALECLAFVHSEAVV